MLTTLAIAVTPILGDYVYVGGGLLGAVLVVLLIVLLVRRV